MKLSRLSWAFNLSPMTYVLLLVAATILTLFVTGLERGVFQFGWTRACTIIQHWWQDRFGPLVESDEEIELEDFLAAAAGPPTMATTPEIAQKSLAKPDAEYDVVSGQRTTGRPVAFPPL
ncbi:hypothetical protein K491DRAFT_677589 [Lophiostoma macrostomum CBS 122681]|uniref:Uncharacterized protein n=1 Tax=Lophiostoma macrostomum CBS 122681 TaxID=1314788 RepID=A0A6A6TAZ8_9PLEO|nr:hypothetical protein K491DRAFT_677589 [Lophiostoma macrostomum CBS 122681]